MMLSVFSRLGTEYRAQSHIAFNGDFCLFWLFLQTISALKRTLFKIFLLNLRLLTSPVTYIKKNEIHVQHFTVGYNTIIHNLRAFNN